MFDLFLVMAFISFIALFSIIIHTMGTHLLDASAGTPLGSALSSTMTPYLAGLQGAVDTGFVIFIGGALLAIIAASGVIFTSPLLFFISFFILIMLVIASFVLSNTYVSIASTASIAPSANQFVYTGLIMTYLPYIIIAMFTIAAIFFYAKNKSGVVDGV